MTWGAGLQDRLADEAGRETLAVQVARGGRVARPDRLESGLSPRRRSAVGDAWRSSRLAGPGALRRDVRRPRVVRRCPVDLPRRGRGARFPRLLLGLGLSPRSAEGSGRRGGVYGGAAGPVAVPFLAGRVGPDIAGRRDLRRGTRVPVRLGRLAPTVGGRSPALAPARPLRPVPPQVVGRNGPGPGVRPPLDPTPPELPPPERAGARLPAFGGDPLCAGRGCRRDFRPVLGPG